MPLYGGTMIARTWRKVNRGSASACPKGGRRRDFLQIVWIWVDKRAEKMDDGGANCTGAEERRRFR